MQTLIGPYPPRRGPTVEVFFCPRCNRRVPVSPNRVKLPKICLHEKYGRYLRGEEELAVLTHYRHEHTKYDSTLGYMDKGEFGKFPGSGYNQISISVYVHTCRLYEISDSVFLFLFRQLSSDSKSRSFRRARLVFPYPSNSGKGP